MFLENLIMNPPLTMAIQNTWENGFENLPSAQRFSYQESTYTPWYVPVTVDIYSECSVDHRKVIKYHQRALLTTSREPLP